MSGTTFGRQTPSIHRTSDAERDRRQAALTTAMEANGLDALLIGARGDEFMRGRIQYVSDVYLWGGWGYVVFVPGADSAFLADPLGGFMGREAGWVTDIRLTQEPGREAASLLSDHSRSGGTIGIVGLADVVAAAHTAQFERALPGATLVDATDVFDDVRAVKSAEEIADLEQTSAILRDVYDALQAEIRPGVHERDVLAEAHRLARQFGCLDGIAMAGRPPVAGFGPGIGGVIASDDVVVIDLEWGGPTGYWLELRRCFSFGPPPSEVRRFWETRVETFEACVAAIASGASSDDILVARDRADAKHGLSAGNDVRYSAHGIGIDSLEPPWVPGKERELRVGMVLSVHPNVQLEESLSRVVGPVSVGDSVLVTANGGRRLTYEREEWIVLEP
jgi:ectoine hydrolase